MDNMKTVFLYIGMLMTVTAPPPPQPPVAVSPKLQDVQNLHDDVFSGYNKNLLPLKVRNKPVDVQFSLSLVSLNNFDEISGEIDMTVLFSFSWLEERIQWNMANYSNISSITVPYNSIWRPQIYLVNAADKIMEIGHEGIMIRVAHDGQASWSPGQVLKYTCSVDIKYYPFDTQRCEMRFVTWSYLSSEVQLDDPTRTLNLSYFAPNSQWEFLDSKLHSGLIENRKYLLYTFKLKRRYQFFIVYLIGPVLLLGVINNLVFAMPVSSGERMSVAITSFLAFAVYMSIINNNVPDNSAPMASLLYYLLFLMTHSSVTMMLTVISLRIHDKDGPVPKPVQAIIKLLRCQYCHQAIVKRRSPKVDVLDINGKSVTEKLDRKFRGNYDGQNMTWTTVGKTFDGYLFFISILLHITVSAVFIYSVYGHEFPEIYY